jgi:ribosome biogenesis GTPase
VSLGRWGWHPFFEGQRRQLGRPDLAFSRVVEEQRGLLTLAGEFDGLAEVSGRFRHEAAGPAEFPAVGDWVGVRAASGGARGVIHVRLERRGTVSRAGVGGARTEQVLAANVDTIFIVSGLNSDHNLRRLERYLTVAWDAGATPVIVLNKADLCEDVDGACDGVRARLPFVDVVAVSAVRNVEPLAAFLRPAETIVLLGSSGVGKSTLVNRLVGRDAQSVNAVREDDGRGRHTTTARQLFELPGGALLIDTPGLRELQAWDTDEAVSGAFSDVEALAVECRFADCAHETEPGCAVRAAVDGGRLDADRLNNYHRLMREAAYEERRHDKAAAANVKRRWKQVHKAARVFYRQREKP